MHSVLPNELIRMEDDLRRKGSANEYGQGGSGTEDVEVAAALIKEVQQVLASTGLPGSRYEAVSSRRSGRLE